MVKIIVKAYLDKYDTQGEETTVETEEVKTKAQWEKEKQTLISDFQKKYTIKGYDGSTFGKGVYKNTEKNRRLGRVGKPFDRGKELRQKIEQMIQDKREVKIENEDKIERNFKYRKWMEKEEEFLIIFKEINENKLSFKQIAERLMRSYGSVYSKYRNIKRKQIEAFFKENFPQ